MANSKDSQASHATDVVIVGAGPTGLMAACLLVRCGIRVRVLDKAESQAHETRAFAIQAKSMELLQSIGLVDEVIRRGTIAVGLQAIVNGELRATLNLTDIGRTDTPYSFLFMCPQFEIESILRDDLASRGVQVEHAVEVTGFTQNTDEVQIQAVDRAGTTQQIHCAFLLGADGAHSIVRKTLGLTFEGGAYRQNFLLADCRIDWPWDYEHVKIFMRGKTLAIYMPIRGRDWGRIVVIDSREDRHDGQFKDTDSAAAAEATTSQKVELSEVESALREAAGADVRLTNPIWTTRYRVHHRGVNNYGHCRVFVAGDAAHIHSPVGGQGMNTGLQDAANLAWKLAMAIRGNAPRELMETYNSERWPIGQKLLRYTDRMFSAMSSRNGFIDHARNFAAPLFLSTLSQSRKLRGTIFHFISQLGIHYHDHDFLLDDIATEARKKSAHAGVSAGHRAPNATIARNLDVFQFLQGYRFHVLALSRRPLTTEEIANVSSELDSLPQNLGIPIQSHLITYAITGYDARIIAAESNQVFENYGLTPDSPMGLFLIRPDGYIAYRSDSLDVAGLKDFLIRFAPALRDADTALTDRDPIPATV